MKKPWSSTKIILLIILGLAIFFRFYQLSFMPGGLFPDEAANGLDINLMEQGQLQPFYERGNGREALFFYWQWFWVTMLGRSPLAHHAASASVGVLAVLACYLVTKKLFLLVSEPLHAEKMALLSAFYMAVSGWHTVLSRTGFRANMIPLFAGLTLWSMLSVPLASNLKKKIFWGVLTGVFFALGFYTYIAFRIMVPLVFVLMLWPLVGEYKNGIFKTLKKYFWPFLSLIVAFVIFFAPLGYYFYSHPGSFVGRSGQVSVFNPELNQGDLPGTVLEVARLSLKAYFIDGDLNWRHNISGRPFLSSIISPFFAVGLILILVGAFKYFFKPNKNRQHFPSFVLLGWFLSFLLPVVTTAEGIPHGLRSIGTIPAVFIITAFATLKIWGYVQHLVRLYPQGPKILELWLKRSLVVLASALIIALPIETYAWYFQYSASSAENFYAFRSDLTEVSKYLKEFGSRGNTYLVLDKFSIQSVDYLTTIDGKTSCDRTPAYRSKNCVDSWVNMPYMQVDPERSDLPEGAMFEGNRVWEKGLRPGFKVVFTQSSIFDIRDFKQAHPNTKLVYELRNQFGQAVLAVYEVF